MIGNPTDPRLIASAIAVACMLVDHLPEPQYNTFHDPGAAAMLSIIFADVFTLLGRRGWKPPIIVAFWVSLGVKFFIQPMFWVRNAWVYDIGTLLLAHAALGLMAVQKAPLRIRLFSCLGAVVAVGIAFCPLYLLTVFDSSWIAFYVQLGAARVLIPCAFWTAVLLVENYSIKSKR